MMDNNSYKIMIIDDHLLFAEGLKAQLTQLSDTVTFSIVTAPVEDTLDELTDGGFHLVIIDLFMPHIHGIDMITQLNQHDQCPPILIISATSDQHMIDEAIRRGAQGFVSKSSSPDDMILAATKLLQGLPLIDIPPQIPPTTMAQPTIEHTPAISPRTSEVLNLLATGLANKAIAQELNISEATVKWHVTQLCQILDVKNRTSCVAKAASLGLLKDF